MHGCNLCIVVKIENYNIMLISSRKKFCNESVIQHQRPRKFGMSFEHWLGREARNNIYP